jgi:hypothetical protein
MRFAALTSLLLALVAFACTSSSSSSPTDAGADTAPAVCPNDLPDNCPTPTPSYATDVKGIIDDKCNGCHANGGVGQSTEDFSTYDRIHSRRGPMLNQVYGCKMPPPDAGQLTADERAKLLGWLVCDAPNN